MGVHSSDSGDIREGRERGEGERSRSEVRKVRGEKGEARQEAVAAVVFKGPVQSSLLTLFGLNLDLNWSRLV